MSPATLPTLTPTLMMLSSCPTPSVGVRKFIISAKDAIGSCSMIWTIKSLRRKRVPSFQKNEDFKKPGKR